MKFKKILSCLLALTIIFSALGNFYVSAEELVKLPGVSTGETIVCVLDDYWDAWDDDPWPEEKEYTVFKYEDFEYIVTSLADKPWQENYVYIINYTGEKSNITIPYMLFNEDDRSAFAYVRGVHLLKEENPYVKTVNISGGITFVGGMNNFTNLEKVSFTSLSNEPSIVIDHYAFSGLNSLKNVYTRQAEIREIGIGAFKDCKNLKTFDFSTNIENIRESAFEGCESLKSSVIAPKNIESRAFYGCKNITSFSAENIYSVEIGQKAFKKCTSLKKVNFDCLIKKIQTSAFENCTALKTVKFNKGYLESINENAFKNCKNLTTIKIGNESKTPSIHKKAFTNAKKGIKFYVMKEKVAKKLKSNLKKSNAKSPKIYVKKYYAYY